MKEIKDKELLEKYIKAYKIDEFFDTQGLPFRLYEYERGEMMNIAHPSGDYLKFIVKGEWDLYYDANDGSRYLVSHSGGFCVIGDTEFCIGTESNRWQEVRTTVHSVEFATAHLRETLMNDNRFLRFLLRNLTEKLLRYPQIQESASTLEERLIYYMRCECQDQMIHEVEQTAFRLNCSRRQLQRVLKKLVEKEILVKKSKGCYFLSPFSKKEVTQNGKNENT